MTEKCARCGYTGDKLCQRNRQPVCYECVLIEDGERTTEDHHPLGRDNSNDVVATPGNLHRFLDARKREWPASLKANVSRDPMLTLAALLRAYADFAEYAARYFRRFSDWLVALHHSLIETFGPTWPARLNLGPLWA
jgi:hypothetical protein